MKRDTRYLEGIPVHDLFLARCQDTKTAPSADREKRFSQSLVRNCSERVLDLRELGFRRLSSEALATWLASEETFVSLVLASNELGDEGAAALTPAILRNTTVSHLDVRSNGITATGAQALCKALEENSTLTSIDFGTAIGVRRNAIGPNGAKALAAVLARNHVLSCIFLRDTGLGARGGEALAPGLRACDALTRLTLSANQLGPTGCIAICAALTKSSSPLEHLDLSGNAVGNPGADSVAKLLAVHPSLESIDISNNAIGPAGMATIGSMLRRRRDPSPLVLLNAADNSAGNAGVVDLARWVAANNVLQTLVLAGNAIASGCELAEALQVNGTLERLDLRHNALGAAGATVLLEALIGNERSALRSLDLANNRIDGSAGQVVSEVIGTNSTLQHLSLRDNRLDEAAGAAIAATAAHNETLLTLNVDVGNSIAFTDFAVIEQQLRKNRTAWERGAPVREAARMARIREHSEQLHEIEQVLSETISQSDGVFEQQEEAEQELSETRAAHARDTSALLEELSQKELEMQGITETASPATRAALVKQKEGRRKQIVDQILENRGIVRRLRTMIVRLSEELKTRKAEFAEERDEMIKLLSVASADLHSSSSDVTVLRQKVSEMRTVLLRLEEHELTSVRTPKKKPAGAPRHTPSPRKSPESALLLSPPLSSRPMFPRVRSLSDTPFPGTSMPSTARVAALANEVHVSNATITPPVGVVRVPHRPSKLAPLKPPPLPTTIDDNVFSSPPMHPSPLRSGRLRSASVAVPPLDLCE